MSGTIERNGNEVVVTGDLDDFHRLLSFIHTAIEKAGYQDLILNLESCTSAFQNSMLSVCAQVMAYRNSGIAFHLKPPTSPKLQNLFRNTGWGYFLDPRQFDPSNFRGHTRIPATQYTSPTEQQSAVNKIVNVILGVIPDMQRSDFAAFEWAVNEITDNVLVHSQSPIGGLVQVSTFEKFRKQVQFVVADAGVGIPTTLRQGFPEIRSDTEALDRAIREGVTRDKKVGQGNGLFGSYQICSKCHGFFGVHSGHARLEYRDSTGLSITNERIPYCGTLVVATIDFSQPKLLEDALRIKGQKYRPIDFVESEYERNSDGKIIFLLSKETNSFGSRVAGKPIRTKLSNLLRMGETEKIYIDLEGIPIMSSSFADEAFGKLFLDAGPVAFTQKFEFVNVMETVQYLINKAIAQRMSAGVID
ncbi:MAG TPA: STAS-like domain-containing protein [Candidatus Methylomirabilis sp.]|nr:STAS-like domain-containing protein [Candidatus Methylomirabilis sp.]